PYVVREIVVARARLPELVATAVAVRLLLAPLFVGAILLWAHFAHYTSKGTLVLYLVGGATLLMMLTEPIQGAFQAIERMQYLALGDAIDKSAQGLLGIVVALIGFGVVGFAGCWLVMSAIVMVLSIRWLSRFARLELKISPREVATMARGSAAYWTGGLFFTLYLWADTVLLSLMTNTRVVGWYGVATKLFQTLLFVAVMAATAWLPRLVSASERSPQELRREARAPIELVLSLALPLAALLAIAAEIGVRLVYGSAYSKAGAPLIILGCCLVPMYLNMILCQVCVASKRMRIWTWIMGGATIFNISINLILIQVAQNRWGNGAIGAAVSLLLTELVIAAAALRVVGLGVFSRSSALRLVRVTIACGGAIGAALACDGLGVAVRLGVGTASLILCASVLRVVSREELAFARQWLGAAGSRLRGRLRHRAPFLGPPTSPSEPSPPS
ncbi:MAG TPA: oligosaccharide flippase family protein, partial [Solirubrobacteraceae bacterium]|nr:oligosaccharide flippase family protein [Solirubrobacteraceae bacterium]